MIAIAAACGTYGGEEPPAPAPEEPPVDAGRSTATDAGANDASEIADAHTSDVEASTPARCNPTAPFGEPAPVMELNTGVAENSAWLTPDELTVYFARASKLMKATRATTMAPFSMPEPAPFVDDDDSGEHPSLTRDELTIVFSRADVLRTSTRPNPNALFPRAGVMPELNSASAAEGTPALADEGREIYFRRNTSAQVGNELFVAARAGAVGAFGAAQRLPVNSASNDSHPVVREDGLELWFASNRAAGNGNRIFVATRPSRQDSFGMPVEVAELNAAGTFNVPAWISPDGCVIWIATNRPGGAGGTDLFRAARPL